MDLAASSLNSEIASSASWNLQWLLVERGRLPVAVGEHGRECFGSRLRFPVSRFPPTDFAAWPARSRVPQAQGRAGQAVKNGGCSAVFQLSLVGFAKSRYGDFAK
jgi:hypothetical protein